MAFSNVSLSYDKNELCFFQIIWFRYTVIEKYAVDTGNALFMQLTGPDCVKSVYVNHNSGKNKLWQPFSSKQTHSLLYISLCEHID